MKPFLNFFLHFWNLVEIWNIFKEKRTLIADVVPKLRTPKNTFRSMPEKSCFRGSVEKQHGKCAQTLPKLERQILYHIYWLLGTQLSYKKSLLVICKISRQFPNTLCADGKYSLLDRDNLTQRIQMLLSEKQKNFFGFFFFIFENYFKFGTFSKKRWHS